MADLISLQGSNQSIHLDIAAVRAVWKRQREFTRVGCRGRRVTRNPHIQKVVVPVLQPNEETHATGIPEEARKQTASKS